MNHQEGEEVFKQAHCLPAQPGGAKTPRSTFKVADYTGYVP